MMIMMIKLIKMTMIRYDSQQGVSRLLIIYLCLLTHTRFSFLSPSPPLHPLQPPLHPLHCSSNIMIRAAQLSTPIYLHRWTAGRIQ